MVWKDVFREIGIKRQQKVAEEKKQAEAKKKKEEERRKMVQKYSKRVEKVVQQFNLVSGLQLERWDPGCWKSVSRESNDYIMVEIRNECVFVAMDISVPWTHLHISNTPGYFQCEVPLATFTEQALAEALLELYRSYEAFWRRIDNETNEYYRKK